MTRRSQGQNCKAPARRRPLRVWLAAALIQQGLEGAAGAAGGDPYIAIATHAEGVVNYVRASEVQALVDLNQSKCMVALNNGEEIRAWQKCASIAGDPKQFGFVSFAAPFGNVFVLPEVVYSLRSTNSLGCSLTLRNGRFIPVNESCADAHKGLIAERALSSEAEAGTR
ncbi:hypothetical protein [Methylocapsa aurea]|uniref:hypothetical protein n=1 Tax=Methylocapsa aurea TaxID=663610 RepID=UPI00056B74E8|nr:hypothetical protein [Methylocapsa aurea]